MSRRMSKGGARLCWAACASAPTLIAHLHPSMSCSTNKVKLDRSADRRCALHDGRPLLRGPTCYRPSRLTRGLCRLRLAFELDESPLYKTCSSVHESISCCSKNSEAEANLARAGGDRAGVRHDREAAGV